MERSLLRIVTPRVYHFIGEVILEFEPEASTGDASCGRSRAEAIKCSFPTRRISVNVSFCGDVDQSFGYGVGDI